MASSTILGSIIDSVPQISNIIAKTVDADVLIVDNNFMLVGETNRYFLHHSVTTVNTMIGQVIVNQKTLIIPDKNEFPTCQACSDFEKCQIAGFIGVPIVYDDRIIGAIALILPKHRIQSIFQDADNYVAFIQNMAEELVDKIQKKIKYNELNQIISDREHILDMLPDSVLFTDNQGIIRYCNKEFYQTFHRNNTVIGEQIQNIIPHKVLYDFFETRREIINQKVLIVIGNFSFYGFISHMNTIS
jgi:transcriptional regulator with PAS, ATPase and Fis domain